MVVLTCVIVIVVVIIVSVVGIVSVSSWGDGEVIIHHSIIECPVTRCPIGFGFSRFFVSLCHGMS